MDEKPYRIRQTIRNTGASSWVKLFGKVCAFHRRDTADRYVERLRQCTRESMIYEIKDGRVNKSEKALAS